MNKLIFTFSFFLVFTASAFAQLSFVRIGGDTTYGSTGANYAYAVFKNTGSTSIDVRFRRTVNELPNTFWTSSICVGVCYAPFVNVVPLENEDPLTIPPGEQDTMDITFDSPNIGIANVVVKLYLENDTNNFIEKDFILNVNAVGINNISSIATSYSLSQNFPNPFNPSTNILFSIPSAQVVSLKVYDILGNEVSNLVNNEKLTAGEYKVDFNGASLSSGIYYYSLKTENFADTKKMILVK